MTLTSDRKNYIARGTVLSGVALLLWGGLFQPVSYSCMEHFPPSPDPEPLVPVAGYLKYLFLKPQFHPRYWLISVPSWLALISMLIGLYWIAKGQGWKASRAGVWAFAISSVMVLVIMILYVMVRIMSLFLLGSDSCFRLGAGFYFWFLSNIALIWGGRWIHDREEKQPRMRSG